MSLLNPGVGSGGGGTQYTQGGATVANPTGTAEIWFDGSGNPKAITPSQPLPSNITDGTNVANVVAGDTGFNGVAVSSGTKTYTFTTSASGAQTLLANTLCEGYSWVEVVYSSVGAGLALNGVWAAASGGNYQGFQSWANASNSPVNNLGTSNNTIYSSPVHGNYFQLAVSALTSGTFTGTVTFYAFPKSFALMGATQSGTWTVGSNSATGSAFPANAFAMGASDGTNLVALRSNPNDATALALSAVGMIFNGTNLDRLRSATQANNTTGTGLLGVGLLEFDGTNYQRVPAARFAPASTSLNTYSTRITTNATTTPTPSTAYVSSITVCVETAGTTSTLDIRDKSGTPLYLVRSLSTASLLASGEITYNFQTPVKMTGGIDVITGGAAAATVNVFVNYYQ